MNRENEHWFSRLGSLGIRRDVLPGKSDESVLYECTNLDPFSVSGAIVKIPGCGTPLMASWAYADDGFSPGIATLALIGLDDGMYFAGVGSQGGDPTLSRMFFEPVGTAAVTTPVAVFSCPRQDLLSPTVQYAGGAVTPRGETEMPVITSFLDMVVDDTTLNDELDYTGPVHRDAKTGFPFAGFVHHNGVNNNANWFPPFATQTDAAADRFDSNVTIGAFGFVQVGANGFGCVGTSTWPGSPTDDVAASDVMVEFPNYPDDSGIWKYGYSHAGDLAAFGWGYKHSSGSASYRLILRWAALGYVYVYADGTTSEMFVLRWQNRFTTYGDPAAGGPGNNGAPVSINQKVDGGSPFTVDVNLCVIAWKVRCRVPADLLSDHTVIGVRVFYNHRSHKQGSYADYADGYNGWTSDLDIFSGMRECMYLDEEDAKVGYCRVESAEYASISGETDGATLQCAYFNYVLCPCELSVAQYAENTEDMPDQAIKTPMTLGRKWGEIRGEIDAQTGVLADLADGRVTVQVIENSQVVKTYAPDDSADGGTAFTTRSNTLVNHVSHVQPRTSVNAYGAFQQVGRLFYWGVMVAGERKVDWFSLYPTHIDQDSIPYPSIVRLDLQVPIRLGEIRGAVPVGRDAIIGTTGGIAIMSFGSGLASEWSRRILDMDVSIEKPEMMRAVGATCYIVGKNGHVYLYLDGAAELIPITRQLAASGIDVILPTYAQEGESYPTDNVFDKVSIQYSPDDERIVVCYSYGWEHVLTLCYDIRSKAFLKMTRFFVASANTLGNIPYVSTGRSVVRLFEDGALYTETLDGGPASDTDGGFGVIDSAGESMADVSIISKEIYNLGLASAWEDRSVTMVGWSAERIRQAVAGLPPGGTLFYHSNGWKNVDEYDPAYSAMDATGNFLFATPLYDTGGKYTVIPDLFWFVKNVAAETVPKSMPWILTFDRMNATPGNRKIITGVMIHGTISDTFTIKFYCDGSATAEQTITVVGVSGSFTERAWVPFERTVRIDIRSTAIDTDAPFRIDYVGVSQKEGSRHGQKR